jgi:aldehyde oxidoreductase
VTQFDLVSGDTAISPDCGKTSASRQTFVTGKAAHMAGSKLRGEILKLAGACACAKIEFRDAAVTIADNGNSRVLSLGDMPLDQHGYVITCEATFDIDLGTVRVLKVTAAHDVGRAINPTLIEGQIEGGVAQGLGMALMEEFFPGKGENLHDYLIPSAGDIPPIESILIEDPSSIGPFGAKGIGEQAVIPTAPAILNAIHDAVGVRIHKVPATPDRVRAAILAKANGGARG